MIDYTKGNRCSVCGVDHTPAIIMHRCDKLHCYVRACNDCMPRWQLPGYRSIYFFCLTHSENYLHG